MTDIIFWECTGSDGFSGSYSFSGYSQPLMTFRGSEKRKILLWTFSKSDLLPEKSIRKNMKKEKECWKAKNKH